MTKGEGEIIIAIVVVMILLNIVAWLVGKEIGIRSANKVIKDMNDWRQH